MADLTGREILIGAKKASAWGTAVACGANDGLLALALDLGQQIELLRDEPMGLGFSPDTSQGRETVNGSLRAHLRYDGQEAMLLALAMGAAGAPTQLGATTAYHHTLQLTDGLAGLFATLAAKKKSDLVFEWPSQKVSGFTIKGGMRIPTEITLDLIGATLARNGGSGTNNTTTIASVTYRDKQNRVIGDENAYVRLNAASGGALAASDNIYPSEFTLTMKRPMEGDHVLDQTSYLTEPLGTGFPECSLDLTFPQFGDVGASRWTDFAAKTAAKLELLLKSGALAGTAENYRLLIQIPQAFLETISANLDGPGKIPNPMRFWLTQANAAPTGMTGVTNPFAIRLVNKRTTDLLA